MRNLARSNPQPRRRFQLLPNDRFVGWTPYLWLAYLPTLFITPAIRHATAAEWLVSAIAAVVFLPLYFRTYWVGGRELTLLTAAIAGLGFALIPVNPSASTFVTYAAAFAGGRWPRRRGLLILGVLCAGVITQAWVLDESVVFWGVQLFFILVVGPMNVHFAGVRQTSARLFRAREEAEQLAALAERERIARDLHDVLGHTLTLIALKSALADRLVATDPTRASREMREVMQVARGALADVRAAVTGYRDVGFAGALVSARSLLDAAGVRLETLLDPVSLSPAEETVLALVLREAVTNVVRHAGATTCAVTLRRGGSARALMISDDGRGPGAVEGNGMRGMRERVATVGGTLNVTTGPASGTRLLVTLPSVAGPLAIESRPGAAPDERSASKPHLDAGAYDSPTSPPRAPAVSLLEST